jgi:hypothetical protein
MSTPACSEEGSRNLAKVEDDHTAIAVFLVLFGAGSRLVDVNRQFQAGLIVVLPTTLLFLPTANLVDDEWRKHG